MQPYKVEVSFTDRCNESARIRGKYPDRVPIVAELSQHGTNTLKHNSNIHPKNRKYLVPKDVTVGQFVYILRRRFKLPPEQAMFIFVNNVMPPTSALIVSLYEQHADEDGFLYVTYSGESVFG